jgi:hypothetical protein
MSTARNDLLLSSLLRREWVGHAGGELPFIPVGGLETQSGFGDSGRGASLILVALMHSTGPCR